MKKIKKFDFKKRPKRVLQLWKFIAILIVMPLLRLRRLKLLKKQMKGLKPPYLLLSNHHSFYDFFVLQRVLFPHKANYIITIDGFHDHGEMWLRMFGGIGKRKFTNDISLIKNMKHCITKYKNIVVMYPEARYSIDGTTSMLPESLGKVVKFLNVPVVTLNMRGNYIAQPQWNKIKRKIPFEADVTQIITKEDLPKLNVEEINTRIEDALQYNDWEYMKQNNYLLPASNRAEHLNRLLYQCPHCKTAHHMHGVGIKLSCDVCGKEWIMKENGSLEALDKDTEFDNVPDWYHWEREMVRKEVENGSYFFEDEVIVKTLPNSKKFYYQGKGYFRHDMNGYYLKCNLYGEPYEHTWKSLENYSCHIEYDYKGEGDCIDISISDESFFIFPQTKRDVITKISLATEEIYKYKHKLVEKNKKNKNN